MTVIYCSRRHTHVSSFLSTTRFARELYLFCFLIKKNQDAAGCWAWRLQRTANPQRHITMNIFRTGERLQHGVVWFTWMCKNQRTIATGVRGGIRLTSTLCVSCIFDSTPREILELSICVTWHGLLPYGQGSRPSTSYIYTSPTQRAGS